MSPDEIVVHAGGPKPDLRQMAHAIAGAIIALPMFPITPLLRPWHSRWGATDDEVAAAMPCDEMVPGCQYVVTRAVTIGASPEAVWPWLVQVGFGKAGYYSYDLLDNAGHRSADRIVPEFQDTRVGDWVPMYTKVNEITAFKIAALERPELVVWSKPDSTWVWRLSKINGCTRLVTRLRILYRWHWPGEAIFSVILNEFGDFPMMLEDAPRPKAALRWKRLSGRGPNKYCNKAGVRPKALIQLRGSGGDPAAVEPNCRAG